MEGALDFKPLLDALTKAITPAQLIAVLASVVGVGMLFFLTWLGVRKAIRAFTGAVGSGSMKM